MAPSVSYAYSLFSVGNSLGERNHLTGVGGFPAGGGRLSPGSGRGLGMAYLLLGSGPEPPVKHRSSTCSVG